MTSGTYTYEDKYIGCCQNKENTEGFSSQSSHSYTHPNSPKSIRHFPQHEEYKKNSEVLRLRVRMNGIEINVFSLSPFSSPSSLSLEDETFNSNPRTLFIGHWSKNLPERVESFSKKPFPLRGSLSLASYSDDESPPPLTPVSDRLLRRRGRNKRTIFRSSPYESSPLMTTASDSVLELRSEPKEGIRKTVSASALLKDKKDRDKSLNVSFSPDIDIRYYQTVVEFYAREDWSDFYV